MDLTEALGKKEISDSLDDAWETEPKERSGDVIETLQKAGYKTTLYDVGIVVGLRTSGIKGARSVHSDLVFVVDLRELKSGKSTIARQSTILDVVNRPLSYILEDLKSNLTYEKRTVLTSRGTLELPSLQRPDGTRSMVLETRTVYVVDQERPIADFSWLTSDERVLAIDAMRLSINSGSRAQLQEFESLKEINWDDLHHSRIHLMYALLALVGIVLSTTSLLLFQSSILSGLIGIAISASIVVYYSYQSLVELGRFNDKLSNECNRVSEIGDSYKVLSVISENEDKLDLITRISIVVTPLILEATEYLRDDSPEDALVSMRTILDEIVRNAPRGVNIEESVFHGTDRGLELFISVFKYLEALEDEYSAGFLYTSLSDNDTLSTSQLIEHATTLVGLLVQSGVLSHSTREQIDDYLNGLGLAAAIEDLEKSDEEEERAYKARLEAAEKERLEQLKLKSEDESTLTAEVDEKRDDDSAFDDPEEVTSEIFDEDEELPEKVETSSDSEPDEIPTIVAEDAIGMTEPIDDVTDKDSEVVASKIIKKRSSERHESSSSKSKFEEESDESE